MLEMIKDSLRKCGPWQYALLHFQGPSQVFPHEPTSRLMQSIWLIEDYFKPILTEGQQVLSKFSEHSDYSLNSLSAYMLETLGLQDFNRSYFFLFYLKFTDFCWTFFSETAEKISYHQIEIS